MKKSRLLLLMLPVLSCFSSSCSSKDEPVPFTPLNDNYRNFYHIFVSSFADSNGDGIGDLNGITENLDKLRKLGDPHGKNSLGISGIFLSPIHPSPTYHKYDITDFFGIDPQFGTMDDFKKFIEEAHKRDIKVILDGVFNHIAVGHPLFMQTINDLEKNIEVCKFYTTSTDPKGEGYLTDACYAKVPNARRFRFKRSDVKFPDGYSNRTQTAGLSKTLSETYKLTYEGFAAGMVDLDLDNEENRKLISDYIKEWTKLGVDGFRLDAVKSYYGEEVIKETKNFEIINFISQEAKKVNPDAYIVAEGPWNTSAMTYQSNTEIDSYFNFGSSRQGFNNSELHLSMYGYDAVNANLVYSWISGLEGKYKRPNGTDAINANFMSNHDIGRIPDLFVRTRDGVTGIDLDQMKLFYAIQNLVSGNFFYYYGDEIGMVGQVQNNDIVARAAYLWTKGVSKYKVSPKLEGEDSRTLEYFQPLDVQQKKSDSLYNYVRHINKVKDYYPSIARSNSERVENSDNKILIINKTYKDEKIKIVINLSNDQKVIDMDGTLLDSLEVGKGSAKLAGGKLTLNKYSIAILDRGGN